MSSVLWHRDRQRLRMLGWDPRAKRPAPPRVEPLVAPEQLFEVPQEAEEEWIDLEFMR